MIEFIKVTAKTPLGDTNEYMFMGDLNTDEDQIRLLKFMKECCDDCADRFTCPEDWDIKDWFNKTVAVWEAVESNRLDFDMNKIWELE